MKQNSRERILSLQQHRHCAFESSKAKFPLGGLGLLIGSPQMIGGILVSLCQLYRTQHVKQFLVIPYEACGRLPFRGRESYLSTRINALYLLVGADIAPLTLYCGVLLDM